MAGLATLPFAGFPSLSEAQDNPLAALEKSSGGRLGVFAVDTGTDRTLAWRADERFLMCSTFKLLLVAATLVKIDAGKERRDRVVPYTEKDLQEYAPTAKAHLAEGGLSVDALCEAAIELSDNTAANLLLASLGGPGAVTAFARGLGDTTFRLDRTEPTLNRPDGDRDTTTPRAMASSMNEILVGTALSLAARQRLEGWMLAAPATPAHLRQGLPSNWRIGHKSGSGNTAANDLAIVLPPQRLPILIAAYFDATGTEPAARDAVLPEVGRIVTRWYVGGG